MPISKIFIYVAAALTSYSVGRFGHCCLNPRLNYPKAPHHWIYGFISIIVGLIFYKEFLLFFSLGIGFIISDLKDFIKLKFFEPDKKGKKRFWGID